jgi:uncharacterized iron-regulated membrane protein
MLFIVAWSGVGFNLRPVYGPVMHALAGYRDHYAALPDAATVHPEPTMDWPSALATGRRLMMAQSRAGDFRVEREDGLYYLPAKNAFLHSVVSDRDIQHRYGGTWLAFAADDGRFIELELPTGASAGNTLTTWFSALHMALVGGWPFRLFVGAVGLAVAGLAGTGVLLWRRKRSRRGGASHSSPDRLSAGARIAAGPGDRW